MWLAHFLGSLHMVSEPSSKNFKNLMLRKKSVTKTDIFLSSEHLGPGMGSSYNIVMNLFHLKFFIMSL